MCVPMLANAPFCSSTLPPRMTTMLKHPTEDNAGRLAPSARSWRTRAVSAGENFNPLPVHPAMRATAGKPQIETIGTATFARLARNGVGNAHPAPVAGVTRLVTDMGCRAGEESVDCRRSISGPGPDMDPSRTVDSGEIAAPAPFPCATGLSAIPDRTRRHRRAKQNEGEDREHGVPPTGG